MKRLRLLPVLALLLTSSAAAQRLDSVSITGMRWRNIGPANMGGRIVDIAGIPSPSHTFYVATAAGGLFKTTNAGTTFRAVLDTLPAPSGGMIGIAPSDTNVVYYGTGEPNMRNSVSPGAGMWKTTDGGRTWHGIGLEKTQHIGRVVVHPRDPNTVYVAAVGAAWASNPERGLYKTTDGGRSWKLAKFISNEVGFIDVALDPHNPNIVWASSYRFRRGPYFMQSGGPGSGLWKSTDAGATWKEITGNGFPETPKGRINLAIAASNPRVMYAMVEADTLPNPKKDSTVKAQPRRTGLYRSADGGKHWKQMNSKGERPFYFSQVRVDPRNPDLVYWMDQEGWVSHDGGKTFLSALEGLHADHHALWIDPAEPRHMVQGDDGGIAQSWDAGGTWTFLNNIAIGQFYNISYDMQQPYRVCGGLQDNGSWCGPSRMGRRPITNAAWYFIGGGDGFVTAQSPDDPDIILSESQGGGISRIDFRGGSRGGRVNIPAPHTFPVWEDSSIMVDGHRQSVLFRMAGKETDVAERNERRNWNTPFFISPHNSTTLYVGANRVLKSTRLGDGLVAISPDLTTRDSVKILVSTKTTGGVTADQTGAERHCTIVSLAESPVRPGMLFAGTDDGMVWVTRNDGATWMNLVGRFPGVPEHAYVSRIEPSHFDSDVIYVAFENHQVNDFRPYLYVSTDGVKTFTSIADDLPTGGMNYVYVVREDVKNRNLLFVGTEIGVYVSIDRGKHWARFHTGLPTVPVRDLQIHPRDGELIAGTHGRSIWIVDIAALQQLDTAAMAAPQYLLKPSVAIQQDWNEFASGGGYGGPGGSNGNGLFSVSGPPAGAAIAYRLAQNTPNVRLLIQNIRGDTIFNQSQPGKAGITRVLWDFRALSKPQPLNPAGVKDSIHKAERFVVVLDSVQKEGKIPAATLDRIRAVARLGQDLDSLVVELGGAGRREPPRDSTAIDERPAERPSREDRKWTAGLQQPLADLMEALQKIWTTARVARPGSTVEAGEYLVTLVVGDNKMQQTLRVEGSGRPGMGQRGDDDDDDPDMDDEDGGRR